jgi:nucleotide-binding universal stress UspA family protein
LQTLRHVLVPLDLGAPASEALGRAVALARAFDASLTLLHVVVDTDSMSPATANRPPVGDVVRARFIEAAAELCARYPRAHAVMRRGMPFAEILSALRDTAADLVVMGASGQRSPERGPPGWISESVARLAPIPVLTVRSRATSAAAARDERFAQIRKILVPSDFGEAAEHALAWATEFAEVLGASVIVTDLRELPKPFDATLPSLEETALRASRHVLGLAQIAQADLIVMSPPGRQAANTLVGCLADEVVRSSTVPVLTLRDSSETAVRSCRSGQEASFRVA